MVQSFHSACRLDESYVLAVLKVDPARRGMVL